MNKMYTVCQCAKTLNFDDDPYLCRCLEGVSRGLICTSCKNGSHVDMTGTRTKGISKSVRRVSANSN